MKTLDKTRERIIPINFETREEYLIFLRHLFEHEMAKNNLSRDSFVLDIGCGEGYGTSTLSKNVKKIIGLDIGERTISNASQKYGSGNCIFTKYDGKIIPYKDNTFDAAVSFHVIEHVQNDLDFISEIYRILKKGGIMVMTTPNKTVRIGKNGKLFNEFHVREYYPDEFEKAVKSKFTDVKMYGVYGNKEVQQIEIERLKLIRKAISLDFFNLSRLVPRTIKSIIIKTLKRIGKNKTDKEIKNNFLDKYSISDFYLAESSINDCLDLFALCKK